MICLLSLLWACSDADIDIQEERGIIQRNQQFDLSSPCAFTILIDNTEYSPTFLPTAFQTDGARVFMKVEFLTTEAICYPDRNTTINVPEIRIEQIRLEE